MKMLVELVAATLLPIVSFADLVPTVYVVPEGTAGNSPTAPYDTWAKAANDIVTAAEAVETHGVVKVLSGAYPSPSGYITTRAYELQVLDSVYSDANPGVITLTSPIANDLPADDDPSHHLVNVTSGTVVFSDTNVFFDGPEQGQNYRAVANCKMTISGMATVLNAANSDLYSGYWSDGSRITFTKNAQCRFNSVYLCQGWGGSDSTLIVEDGASMELTGRLWAGASAGSKATVVVSNATINAGSQGYVFGTSGEEKQTRVVLAGSAPILKSNYSANFRGDTELTIDIAEMPVTGYVDRPLFNTELLFDDTTCICIEGVESLRSRLRMAGVTSLKSEIATGWAGGNSIVIPDEVLVAANGRLAGTGFSLEVNGAHMYLNYVEQGGFGTNVYLNADNANPQPPYDSWSRAATTLADARFFLAKGGTVIMASGTYAQNPVAPEMAATFKAVSEQESELPGTVVLGSTIFSGIAGTNVDPQRHILTLALGTFLVPDSEIIFLDSSGGNNSSNRLVVSGAETVFSDLYHTMYIGYAAQNTQLVVKDGAKCYASTIYSGRSGSGAGSTITVKDGGHLGIAGTLSMGVNSSDAKFVIDNATAVAKSIQCGSSGTALDERIVLKGAAPYFESKEGSVNMSGNSTLEIDVSDFKLGAIDDKEARIYVAQFDMNDETSFVLSGIENLAKRLNDDEDAPRRITYPLIRGWLSLNLTDAKLTCARAALPKGWELIKENNILYLKAHKSRGLVITLR